MYVGQSRNGGVNISILHLQTLIKGGCDIHSVSALLLVHVFMGTQFPISHDTALFASSAIATEGNRQSPFVSATLGEHSDWARRSEPAALDASACSIQCSIQFYVPWARPLQWWIQAGDLINEVLSQNHSFFLTILNLGMGVFSSAI